MYITTLEASSPLTVTWLSPCLGSCSLCYYEHWGAPLIFELEFSFFSVCLSWSGIAGSYGNCLFSFWGTSVLFSTVAAPAFPSAVWEGSLCSTASPAFVGRLSDDSCADWYEVLLPHCSFDWVSPIVSSVEHFFICLLAAVCMSSLERCLSRSSALFLLACLFFWHWVIWAVCIF